VQGVFITGTDTGIGKTWATLGLMRAWRERGVSVAGMKPVATGCDQTAAGLRNTDALLIRSEASREVDYAKVNPYAFQPPAAPLFAARAAGISIDAEPIRAAWRELSAWADRVVVEGVGGWRMTLDRDLELAGVVRELGWPVILVVGMRLGCINHARLTVEAVQDDGVVVCGWIASCVDPGYGQAEETIALLTEQLPAPLLGVIPHLDRLDIGRIAANLQPPEPLP